MKTRVSFALLLVAAATMAVALSWDALDELGALLADRLAENRVWALLAVAAAAQLIGHVLRARKHAVLLREIRPIKQVQVFRGQMIGLAFNALLPLRLGEVLRAHYVGRTVQISRSAVFATIMFERLVDLFVVAALGTPVMALTGGFGRSPLSVPMLLAWVLFAAIVVVLAVAVRQPRWYLRSVLATTGLFNTRLQDRARQVAWSFSHALLYSLSARRTLRRYLGLSLVMWTAYFGSAAAIAAAVLPAGPAPQPQDLATLLEAPYLGVTTTTAPAWLGSFADKSLALVSSSTASPADAALFTLLAWILLIAPSILIGSVGLAHRALVEHMHGEAPTEAARNKLFRELDTSREFAHLLSAHFQGEQLGRVVSREEALGRFTVVRPLKGGSHAATMLVQQDGTMLVKKITLPQYRSKLESQHRWLADRAGLRNIVDATGKRAGNGFFSIDIEYRPGYRSFFEHLHSGSNDAAWDVMRRILDFTDAAVYRDEPVDDRRAVLDRYMQTKVVEKVRDAAAIAKDVSQLLGYDHLVVNGVLVDNLHAVLQRIREHPIAMHDLTGFSDGPIHGDLTIDNVMVDPATGDFMLIDPNDENLISDRVVDYGKILQSLHSGYEFLLLHDDVRVSGNAVSFEERRSAQYAHLHARCSEYFVRTLGEERARTVLFHEAVHYTRMLTYRAEIDSGTVAVYFSIAVRLFNEFLDQYPSDLAVLEAAVGGAAPRHRHPGAPTPVR